MFSLMENTWLHKGLKIISCHIHIFSHLKGKKISVLLLTNHKTTRIGIERSAHGQEHCYNMTTQMEEWVFLLFAIKNLSFCILK